jgi:hypothetical protein
MRTWLNAIIIIVVVDVVVVRTVHDVKHNLSTNFSRTKIT